MRETAELRHRTHIAPPLLRIRTKQRLGSLSRLSARLVKGQHISRTKLVLPLAPTLVAVALIICLAARAPHLQHKAALTCVEKIDFLSSIRTKGAAHETR